MAAQVIVDTDAEGNVTVSAAGVTGTGCAALTAGFERALGTTTADVKTADWNKAPQKQGVRNVARQ